MGTINIISHTLPYYVPGTTFSILEVPEYNPGQIFLVEASCRSVWCLRTPLFLKSDTFEVSYISMSLVYWPQIIERPI